MRVLIQRVSESKVLVDKKVVGEIEKGLLLLVGIEASDNQNDIEWIARKVINMRIFSDDADKMNLSLLDVKGDILVISQFTLQASTKKGNRPSYINAAKPEIATPIYDAFKKELSFQINKPIQSGIFGADMKVHLINDGPVTIWIDSKDKK